MVDASGAAGEQLSVDADRAHTPANEASRTFGLNPCMKQVCPQWVDSERSL